jgi:DNA-binding IclR family transcriptional regulator
VAEDGKYRVELVERTFALLDAFGADSRELTLRELVARTGQSQSSVYRIAQTLLSLGVLERDVRSGRYRIGSRLYALGSLAVLDLRRVALPVMEELKAEFGLTVSLSTHDGASGILVEVLEGAGPYGVALAVGSREPLHCTASGKCALAFAERPERALLLASLELVRFTSATVATRRALEAELDEVASLGYAIDRGEWAPHVCCVAVPLFDRHARACGALSVAGPAQLERSDSLAHVVERLLAGAAAVSRGLGCVASPLDSVLAAG